MLDVVQSRWLGALALVLALAVAGLVSRLVARDAPQGHNPALDGLRGYLAFGVFLHHAVVSHTYLVSGRWEALAGTPFRDFGLLCVPLFFMITSFLFVGKLLDARGGPVDWLGLYVSRVLRICPLYYGVVAVSLGIVAVLSAGQLREPPLALAREVRAWLSFTFFAAPAVNHVPTGVLSAGVTWTLAYEWLFYLCLPLIAVPLRCRPPWLLVAAATGFVAWVVLNRTHMLVPIAFAKGALAALVVRQPWPRKQLLTPAAAAAALLAAAGALAGLYAHGLGPWLPWLVFCVAAAGNPLFGILSNRAALALGDISYGVYMIHGLVLTAVLRFGVGVSRIEVLDTAQYWGVICAIGIAVVLLASASYHLLERPQMQRARRVTASLRALAGGWRPWLGLRDHRA